MHKINYSPWLYNILLNKKQENGTEEDWKTGIK